jgi:hypothetical protein
VNWIAGSQIKEFWDLRFERQDKQISVGTGERYEWKIISLTSGAYFWIVDKTKHF